MDDVLLVTVDSLRADHVGYHGYDRDTTPNIDRLADQGVSFSNAFAHACSTRPSFPCILTSAYATMYGGYERVADDQTLLAEVFDDAGYATAGFHSNLYLGGDFGYDRGFDTFYDSKTDPSPTARLRQLVKTHLDDDGRLYGLLQRAFNLTEKRTGIEVGSAYVDAADITDRALSWARRTTNTPRFLWVHYMDVHHPYVPPDEYQRVFRDDPISKQRAIRLRRKMLEEPDAVTEDQLSDIIDLYDAEIRFCDDEIYRLISQVRDIWGDVNVMVTSDHGEEFREHGQFSHHATFYDEVIHVPLILDDGEHDGKRDELVGLIDVSPTLVEAAGLSIPENFHGKSLLQLFKEQWNRDAILGDWLSTNTGEERFAYRSNKWKYIRYDDGEELYDLKADPNETTNVVNERYDIANRCRKAVRNHRRVLEQTATVVGEVEMEEQVKERLRQLGYQE